MLSIACREGRPPADFAVSLSHCRPALGEGRGFVVSGQRGPQETLGALGQFPDYVCGGHDLCYRSY